MNYKYRVVWELNYIELRCHDDDGGPFSGLFQVSDNEGHMATDWLPEAKAQVELGRFIFREMRRHGAI